MQACAIKTPFVSHAVARVATRKNVLVCPAHQSYQVDIVVGPDEPQDSAMKRFRREVMSAGLVQEVRRRRNFENSVDKKKRKEKDCRIKTRRDRKFPPRTYSQTMAPEPSPFNDMFGTPDDLFADVLSGDEGKK